MLSFYQNLNLLLGFAGAFHHEALQVPPLLPEYLDQAVMQSLPEPIHIVIQSLPTDWNLICVTAAATVLGSFGGALIGGLVAYKGTMKANNSLLKRQKLEEALAIIIDLKSPVKNMALKLSISSFGDGGVKDSKFINNNISITNYQDAKRLETLLRIYGNKLFLIAKDFCSSLDGLNTSISIANAFDEYPSDLANKAKNCEDQLYTLEQKLTKKLNL